MSQLHQVQADDGDLELFDAALEKVCRGLAEDVVRNGEGTGHVMEVRSISNYDHHCSRFKCTALLGVSHTTMLFRS